MKKVIKFLWGLEACLDSFMVPPLYYLGTALSFLGFDDAAMFLFRGGAKLLKNATLICIKKIGGPETEELFRNGWGDEVFDFVMKS